ncbi:hypothetical protein [Lyngbya aestuarii]|uniref:hypothetical protein n=1 Tax=Lyngbya aestuarii TaxID=118322 RepID=UPI00403DB196
MEESKPHDDPVIYSARGKVCGIYQPSSKNFLQGTLLTEDQLEIPARLTDASAQILTAHPEFLQLPLVWKCYPRLNPPLLVLAKLKTKDDVPDLRHKGINKFRIVGQVVNTKNQVVTVLIKRNELPRKGEEQLFTLTLRGQVPTKAIGQFWKFIVKREGLQWNIITGQPVPNIEQPVAAVPSSVSAKLLEMAQESKNQVPQDLSQVALARRLSVSSTTIAKHRKRTTFSKWSQERDPHGLAWQYDPDTQRFTPIYEETQEAE